MNSAFMSSRISKHLRSVIVVAGTIALIGTTAAQADLLSVGRTSDGGLGIGVNAGVAKVGVKVGGGSVASVDADVAGVDAQAKVGGGSVASACVGSCGAATAPGATPGAPGTPGATATPVAALPTAPVKPVVPKVLTCAAAGGNTTAFNGYPLHDRDGRMLGIVHSAELDGQARIKSVSIQSVKKRCTSVSRTNFTVAGYAIKGAFDARKSGMAFTN